MPGAETEPDRRLTGLSPARLHAPTVQPPRYSAHPLPLTQPPGQPSPLTAPRQESPHAPCHAPAPADTDPPQAGRRLRRELARRCRRFAVSCTQAQQEDYARQLTEAWTVCEEAQARRLKADDKRLRALHALPIATRAWRTRMARLGQVVEAGEGRGSVAARVLAGLAADPGCRTRSCMSPWSSASVTVSRTGSRSTGGQRGAAARRGGGAAHLGAGDALRRHLGDAAADAYLASFPSPRQAGPGEAGLGARIPVAGPGCAGPLTLF